MGGSCTTQQLELLAGSALYIVLVDRPQCDAWQRTFAEIAKGMPPMVVWCIGRFCCFVWVMMLLSVSHPASHNPTRVPHGLQEPGFAGAGCVGVAMGFHSTLSCVLKHKIGLVDQVCCPVHGSAQCFRSQQVLGGTHVDPGAPGSPLSHGQCCDVEYRKKLSVRTQKVN